MSNLHVPLLLGRDGQGYWGKNKKQRKPYGTSKHHYRHGWLSQAQEDSMDAKAEGEINHPPNLLTLAGAFA